MEERLLTNKKHGMRVLLLTILLLIGGLALVIFGGIKLDAGKTALGAPLFILGMLLLCLGWIPALGLRILKPQEALVLTLFGKYI